MFRPITSHVQKWKRSYVITCWRQPKLTPQWRYMVFWGMGKTELVNVVGREEAIRRQFDGGILAARVGPGARPPSYYLRQWLTLMGHTLLTEIPIEHLRQRLQSELHGKQALVIVDGPLHAAEVEPFRLPGVAARYVVISSRRDLRFKLERQTSEAIGVEPLDRAAGRRMFKALLPKEPDLFNVPATWIDEAADGCGGLPLAIELAAKAVVRVGWERFRAGMASPRKRLTVLSLPMPDELHHSLLLTLYAGYLALSAELQKRLAVLVRLAASEADGPHTISPAQAAQLWATDELAAEGVLEELTDTSWLRSTPGGDYALQPFASELMMLLADRQAQKEMLKSYSAVRE
jgi:hypothetical protein